MQVFRQDRCVPRYERHHVVLHAITFRLMLTVKLNSLRQRDHAHPCVVTLLDLKLTAHVPSKGSRNNSMLCGARSVVKPGTVLHTSATVSYRELRPSFKDLRAGPCC